MHRALALTLMIATATTPVLAYAAPQGGGAPKAQRARDAKGRFVKQSAGLKVEAPHVAAPEAHAAPSIALVAAAPKQSRWSKFKSAVFRNPFKKRQVQTVMNEHEMGAYKAKEAAKFEKSLQPLSDRQLVKQMVKPTRAFKIGKILRRVGIGALIVGGGVLAAGVAAPIAIAVGGAGLVTHLVGQGMKATPGHKRTVLERENVRDALLNRRANAVLQHEDNKAAVLEQLHAPAQAEAPTRTTKSKVIEQGEAQQ